MKTRVKNMKCFIYMQRETAARKMVANLRTACWIKRKGQKEKENCSHCCTAALLCKVACCPSVLSADSVINN